MSILGTRVVRVEDPRFLTGGGTYIANLRLQGTVHVTYVRSTVAHARILSVDTSEAAAMPGVLHVWTSADVDIEPARPDLGMVNQQMEFPYLARDVVRFVGEPVAMIVSREPGQGADAAETVIIDYDPLPVVVDVEESHRGDTLLHPVAGTNVALAFTNTDERDIFEGCEVVVDLEIENQKVATAPLEVRACAARWDGSELTQWACSQGADAAETVVIDYDPLPVVVDVEESHRGDTLLHPVAGTNVALAFTNTDERDIFEGCEVVVELEIE
ncbi:MAG: xanthine dehydrogenase family protein molybdopterin-binding subunit, partial [Acidimicrobiales bacterium]